MGEADKFRSDGVDDSGKLGLDEKVDAADEFGSRFVDVWGRWDVPEG